MHVHTNINTRSLSVYEVWLLAVWSHPQLQPEERHGRYGYTFCTASLVSQEPEISSLLYSAGNKQKVLLPNRSWQKQVNKEYIISINILEPALRFITIGMILNGVVSHIRFKWIKKLVTHHYMLLTARHVT